MRVPRSKFWTTKLCNGVLCIACIFIFAPIHTHAEFPDIDVSQPIRISQMIPSELNLFCLAIDPVIPEDFIALSEKGNLDYSDWVYWGPKDVLTAYFEDPKTLKTPILRVKFALETHQTQVASLDEQGIRQMAAFYKFTCDFGKWGYYPFGMLSGNYKGELIHLAFVGPNADSGIVLLFYLVVPQTPNGPDQALKLWEDFFKKTKQLPIPLFFKANGQELHPGYTIVDVIGHKIKVIAEMRKSDYKVRFMVIPRDSDVCFKFENAFKALMGSDWHLAEPLLKLEGSYVIKDGQVNYSMVTSVLIENVDKFTAVPKSQNNVFCKEL